MKSEMPYISLDAAPREQGCPEEQRAETEKEHVRADIALLVRLVEKCIREGREDDGERIFASAGIVGLLSGDEALTWGRIAEILGRSSDAIQAYTKALEDPLCAPKALAALGQISLEKGGIEESRSLLSRAFAGGIPPVASGAMEADIARTEAPETDFDPLPIRDRR